MEGQRLHSHPLILPVSTCSNAVTPRKGIWVGRRIQPGGSNGHVGLSKQVNRERPLFETQSSLPGPIHPFCNQRDTMGQDIIDHWGVKDVIPLVRQKKHF